MSKKDNTFTLFIYKIECFVIKILFSIFNILGFGISSFLCGILALIIGPFTPPTFTIWNNLKIAFPNYSFLKRFGIVFGTWINLGRFIGEYPNIYKKNNSLKKHIYVGNETQKVFDEITKNNNGVIFFSGHIANWEVGVRVLIDRKEPPSVVYRPMNNRFADELTISYRSKFGVKMIEKGTKGAIRIIRALKNKEKVIILADQKLNNGITVPFFGKDAKTTDSIAYLSLKYNIPIYPCRVIRKGFSSKLELKVEEKINFLKTSNINKDIFDLTLIINQKLEEWIKEYPCQWFWVHNRWKK